MIIRDKVIDTPILDIFNDFKQYCHNTLHLNLFSKVKITSSEIITQCPFHKDGMETKPSFGILLQDKRNIDGTYIPAGACNCFTCGWSGSFTRMISAILGYNDLGTMGEEWILERYEYAINYENVRSFTLFEDKKVDDKPVVSEMELEQYRYYHNYMWKRGLTADIVNEFDVGYDKNTRCLTFPVNDINGVCRFIVRRSVDTKFFNYPSGVQKEVYLLDKFKDSKEVVVCESVINALTCIKYGKPAIAMLGTGTSYQYDLLKYCGIRHYILAFDGDNAGRKATRNFSKVLGRYKLISVLNIPEGKDVNDLSEEQFNHLEEYSINY